MSGHWGDLDAQTVRTWVWRFTLSIAELKNKKVSWVSNLKSFSAAIFSLTILLSCTSTITRSAGLPMQRAWTRFSSFPLMELSVASRNPERTLARSGTRRSTTSQVYCTSWALPFGQTDLCGSTGHFCLVRTQILLSSASQGVWRSIFLQAKRQSPIDSTVLRERRFPLATHLILLKWRSSRGVHQLGTSHSTLDSSTWGSSISPSAMAEQCSWEAQDCLWGRLCYHTVWFGEWAATVW